MIATLLFAATTLLSGSADGWLADGESVTLPHTWNALDATDGKDVPDDWATAWYSAGSPSYLRKAVSYRRVLRDPKPGKRYFIRCGGASEPHLRPVFCHSLHGREDMLAAFRPDRLTVDGEARDFLLAAVPDGPDGSDGTRAVAAAEALE